MQREIEILDIATPMRWPNWLICLAGIGLQSLRIMPPSGQDLAGWCCRGGILRAHGDDVVVASK